MIKVVGLGFGPEEITVKGLKAVQNAKKLFVKTALTPAGAALKEYSPEYLDDMYESSGDFDTLNTAIAKKIASYKDAVYCVDGDGFSDGSAAQLCRIAQAEIISGASAGETPAEGRICLAATALYKKPYIDGSLGLCVTEIDSREMAGDVKLYLMEFYPPHTPVLFRVGSKSEKTVLEEIDRKKKYGFSCRIYIPPFPEYAKDVYSFGDLIRITERLTADDGCPWDKVQTHESIRVNLIEEAYEAVDAIDGGEYADMAEEFGDVLLQSVLHCDIARRSGEFTVSEVITVLCKKLVARHTHIFGADRAGDDKEALKYWEAAKAAEKKTDGLGDELKRLPESFPALLRGQKTVKKAVKFAKADYDTFKKDRSSLGAKLLGLCAEAAEIGADAEVELNRILNEMRDNLDCE